MVYSQIVNHPYPTKQLSPIAIDSPFLEQPQNSCIVDNFLFNNFTYQASVYQEMVLAPPSLLFLFLQQWEFVLALSLASSICYHK
ncbi:hypothetical protein L873DRAFT_1801843 [Choiromyces venosus 120613-1]|uniref:Uncharacterized protein n=1 Tax=Choiromyces venosus 120613-1 TaxID=1336337 RepID=A0A3N4KA14_9PEZI|nr:hypothetical protein L873DRAFT_1821797 [Choiromyces venosus 120613-1]RPB02805.1 hypothetical protein L873DRAFT_1801843 [Choiromyces venosus 120613-1]